MIFLYFFIKKNFIVYFRVRVFLEYIFGDRIVSCKGYVYLILLRNFKLFYKVFIFIYFFIGEVNIDIEIICRKFTRVYFWD